MSREYGLRVEQASTGLEDAFIYLMKQAGRNGNAPGEEP
jgi:hypothetical protein